MCRSRTKYVQRLPCPAVPDYHAHALGDFHGAQNFLYSVALLSVLYLARNSALSAIGHQHEIPAGNRDVCRDSRALRADLRLGYLDDYFGADGEFFGYVLGGKLLGVFLLLLAAVFAHDFVGGAVGGGREDVPVMEEGVLGLAYVHERGFQAGFEILDFALENRAHHALVAGTLDFKLLHHAVGEQRNALFERLDVYDDFPIGSSSRLSILLSFREAGAFWRCILASRIEGLLGNRLHDFLRRPFRQIVNFVVGVFLFHCFALILGETFGIMSKPSCAGKRFEPDPKACNTSIRKFRHNSSLAGAPRDRHYADGHAHVYESMRHRMAAIPMHRNCPNLSRETCAESRHPNMTTTAIRSMAAAAPTNPDSSATTEKMKSL